MVLLSDEAQVVARFGPFGDSVNLAQDGCTVCAECTIGDVGHVKSCFIPFGDGISVGAR